MSISVVKEPSLVDLTGSSLPLWLSSNNIYSQNGAAFSCEITFSSIPNDGTGIDFSWLNGEYEVKIEFDSNPDNTGEEIGISGSSVEDWIDGSLIPGLRANYDLDRFYTFGQPGAQKVRIVAKNIGTDYDIIFNNNTSGGTITLSPAVDPVFKKDFRILLILEHATMDDPDSIDRIEKVLNVIDDTAYFQLEEQLYYLHNRVLPNPDQTGIKNLSANVIKYRGRYTEMYEAAGFTSKVQDGSWKYGLPGGRSREAIVAQPDLFQGLFDGGNTSAFLTYRTERKVSENEPLLLTFFIVHLPSGVDVVVRLIYDDGSDESVVIASKGQASRFEMYCFDAGYQKIKEHIDVDKTLSRWEVSAATTGGDISNKVKVSLDKIMRPDEIFLLYQNSLGADEIHRFSGELTRFSEFRRNVANNTVTHPQESPVRVKATTRSEYRDYFTLRTGYLTKAEMDQLIEVLNSPDMYLLMNGNWLPVTTDKKEIERSSTNSGRANNGEIKVYLDWERFYADV